MCRNIGLDFRVGYCIFRILVCNNVTYIFMCECVFVHVYLIHILYVCIIRTDICIFLFVNVNIVYPFQHIIIIVRPTANAHIVIEDSSYLPDHRTAQNSVSYVINCDVYH